MDSFLLYRDSSTEGKKSYYSQRDMIKDLNLDILFRTMAREDTLIAEKARKMIMLPLTTPEEILYRQDILTDLYTHSDVLDALYECAGRQQKALRIYKEETEKNRTRTIRKTSEILETLKYLNQGQEDLIFIRDLLKENEERLHAEGLQGLLLRLQEEPLDEIREKLQEMDFFVSGGEIGYTFQFGGGMKIDSAVINYCVNKQRPKKKRQGGLQKLYFKYVKKDTIPINNNETLQHDVDHLKEFTVQHLLKMFRPYLYQMKMFFDHFTEEIAFYMGIVNFMKRMNELSIPLVMPEPKPIGTKDTSFNNLYELSMAIYMQKEPVGNHLKLENNILTLITGANQGGKSTFLRSYGIAQVLMQCGMPVPAYSFSAPVYRQIFTHFTRREDEQLNSGRLREELQRMNGMIEAAEPNCLFLLNESFASTTEKEGSRIAEEILHAFYEKEITTIMVTHLFQLARTLYAKQLDGTAFLVAERREGGERTYRMLPGEPSYTSYGTDLFQILENSLYKEKNEDMETND